MMRRRRTLALNVSLVVLALVCTPFFAAAQDVAKKGAQTGEEAVKLVPLAVRCLAFSPNGKSLAAGYGNNEGRGRLVVWDVEARKPRFAKDQSAVVPSVAYSPDGELLAVGSFTPDLRLFNPETGELRREWKAHDLHVRSVVFSPNGKQLATASYDRTIKLWDVSSAEVLRVLRGHQAPLRVVSISPDGKWLAAAGGEEDVVRVWSLEDPNKPPVESKLPGYVPQVAFSPDSHTLAIGCWVAGPILIDMTTGEESARFTDMGGIHWISFSPDGRWMAVATNGRDVYIFPARQEPTEEQRREITQLIEQFEDDDYAQREAASRRLGDLAAVALPQLREGLESKSAEVRVRCRRLLAEAQSGSLARKLAGHTDELECLAFSSDSKYLASGDWQGVINIWNVTTWNNVATLK